MTFNEIFSISMPLSSQDHPFKQCLGHMWCLLIQVSVLFFLLSHFSFHESTCPFPQFHFQLPTYLSTQADGISTYISTISLTSLSNFPIFFPAVPYLPTKVIVSLPTNLAVHSPTCASPYCFSHLPAYMSAQLLLFLTIRSTNRLIYLPVLTLIS